MNKELIELMQWLRPYTPTERLEMLLEAARTVGMPELEAAIKEYWEEEKTTDSKLRLSVLCHHCHGLLEIDIHFMEDNYPSFELKDIAPEQWLLWCNNCEIEFNGNGEEI